MLIPIQAICLLWLMAMAYIDFGMMDQLDELTKETLVDAASLTKTTPI